MDTSNSKDNGYVKSKYVCCRVNEKQQQEIQDLRPFPYAMGVKIKDMCMFSNRSKDIALRNGMDSLRKKLGLSEPPLTVKLDGYLPTSFYSMLSESMIDDETAVQVYGMMTKELLKSEFRAAMAKRSNKRKADAVMSKGVVECYRTGEIKSGEFVTHQIASDAVRESMEESEKLKLDLPRGQGIGYKVGENDKLIYIESFKDEGFDESCREEDAKSNVNYEEIEREFEPPLKVCVINKSMRFKTVTKRRHYFIYSQKPGYYKTSFMDAIVEDYNGCQIKDLNNFCGVRSTAQFYCIDEFSDKTNVSFTDFKALTGGKPKFFRGNKKSFGKAFTPRKDMQLIIASNKHLFKCVGSVYDRRSKQRCMPWEEAKQLFDRFHIYRLDEEDITELIHGAACLSVQDEHYEEFGVNKVNVLWEKRPVLFLKFLKYIDKRIPKKPNKTSCSTTDDEESENAVEENRIDFSIFDMSMKAYRKEEAEDKGSSSSDEEYGSEFYTIKLDWLRTRYVNNLARYFSWHCELRRKARRQNVITKT